MSKSCYKLLSLFLFHFFIQVATNFTFTSKTSVLLLLFKSLSSIATKNLLVIIVKHKLKEVFLDGIRRNVQLGHFILLIVPISQQLPRLTFLCFLIFLKWQLKFDCIFGWQQSAAFEQWTPTESWKFCSCK